ncbi:MAG TPA: hypothetical protein GX739_07200 [Firmicutes bacterium]|nr:hypothetical protein [Bacillota bacterium]
MALSKALAWTTALIAGLLAYYGLVLAANLSAKYLWLLALAGAVGLVSKGFFDRIAHEKLLARLRSLWAKSGEIEKTRNFTDISRYFKLISIPNSDYVIDDRTWEDLDGNPVFSWIDRTLSVYGQQYLYSLLRTPVFSGEELKRRASLIRFFQSNPELREQVQTILARIGSDDTPNVISFLIDPPQIKSLRFRWLYILLAYLAVASILSWIIWPQLAVVAVVLVFVINLIIHSRVHKKISGYFHLVRALRKMVHYGKKLVAVEAVELALDHARIKRALAETATFMRYSSQIGLESADPLLGSVLQYVSILFLLDVRGFERTVALIRRHRAALLAIYEWIGEMDALQAVASYRESLTYYCEPVLEPGRGSGDKLVGEAMYHPLIENPVPNSLTVGTQGVLITGSNMSGKSTFLRTVAVNALFAQTVYTCLAKAYRSQFLKLLTSIGRSDNIIEGKSYYLVEAQSILRIIKAIEAETEVTIMAIFDEMYRGTNSEERIKAGYRVLKYVSQPGTIILVATHDLELTKLLESSYVNYHFRERVGEHGLEFDYTLKPGPSQTRNAIALLRALGYPEVITD